MSAVKATYGPTFGLRISSPQMGDLLTPGGTMDIIIHTTAELDYAHPTHLYISHGGVDYEVPVAGLPMDENYIVVPGVPVPSVDFTLSADTFPDAVEVYHSPGAGVTIVSPAIGETFPIRGEFSITVRANDLGTPVTHVYFQRNGFSPPLRLPIYGLPVVDGAITIPNIPIPIHSDRIAIIADTLANTLTVEHGYHEGVDILAPAHGTTFVEDEPFDIVLRATDANDRITLVLVNERNITPPGGPHAGTISIQRAENRRIYIQAVITDGYPDGPLTIANIIHQIDPGSISLAPEVPSGLIWPSGKWRFSQVDHIAKLRFSFGELLSQTQRMSELQAGEWYRFLYWENPFARYGNIDTGTPIYRWEEKDYGGGQVARWPVVDAWKYPWAEQQVPHFFRLVYDNAVREYYPLMDSITWGVISRSTDAGLSWNSAIDTQPGFPSTGHILRGHVSVIPYGEKVARHEVYCDFLRETSRGLVMNTPDGEKRIYHLYHVTKISTEIVPANGTPLLEGQDVQISATALGGNILTSFTVDGTSVISTNPFTKVNVQADVYVSAIAIFNAPDATDGTPYSFQCSSDICGTQTWSADGLPPGLSINSSTGLISGTVPYDTAAGDYIVTVTLDNDGRIVTRQLSIHVNFVTEPVPGLIWEAVAKIEGIVTALCQTASGAILIGTDTAKIYRTTDLEDFTHVDTMIGTVTSIIQLESGTVLAGCYHSPGLPSYLRRSTNDGATWANGAETPWFSPTITDMIESPTGTVRALGMFGPLGRIDHHTSTDDGVTMTSAGYAGLVATQFGRVNMDNTGKLLATCSGGGYAAILRAYDGNNLAFIEETDLADVRVGPIVMLEDGRFLAAIHDRVYRGSADGTTWELLQTLPAWGGLATPAFIGAMFAGVVGGKDAVVVCCKNALDAARVYRSGDGFETYTASDSVIDGDLSFKMIRLANGTMLMGTDGSTTNLWKSEPA